MKYYLIAFLFALSLCDGLRHLEFFHHIEQVQLDLEGEKIVGEKEVKYQIIELNVPKIVRYFFRGTSKAGPLPDYIAQLQKEMKEKYPEDFKKSKFIPLGTGTIKRVENTVYIKSDPSKYGENNALMLAAKLKYRPEYKKMKFVTS